MKNREGMSDLGILLVLIVMAVVIILTLGATAIAEHKEQTIKCVNELQLIKTLPDSVQFYRISPDCINATPKDTVHG